MRGKLDQRAGHLEVKYAISRDIKDEDIDQMMQKLADWDASSSEVLKSVEEKMKLAKDNYDVEQERRKEHAAKVEEAKSKLSSMDVEGAQASMDAEYYEQEETDFRRSGRSAGKRRMQHNRAR